MMEFIESEFWNSISNKQTHTKLTTLLNLINTMSDSGRWDFGDRAEAKLKPDSEKSTWEHVSDKFKGTADNAAASAQPEVSFSESPRF